MTENWIGGHLDDGAWWWAVALDGIVGGVIGGLMTAFAVAWTIRHERKMAQAAALRAAVARLSSVVWVLGLKLANDFHSLGEMYDRVAELYAAGREASSLASTDWPELRKKIDDALDTISAVLMAKSPVDRDELSVALLMLTDVDLWLGASHQGRRVARAEIAKIGTTHERAPRS
ncbi:hypothetical protein EKO23_01870 [Nocardioides guangzhouensis]|uniref:Uncharacterized protein n=1 Tax=Nocardioides guangzhouensis TaxID=2497878 RepID=A0A4Q4ZJY8_9ACTN|nr:hypothetical protein [Nocardioides guangzhouensis]RYP88662.1 hypothetical protein EKO23_01870 [Nocardioides guangzhouensis]